MSTFSKYHRYHENGQDPNVNNVAAFGRPARSLFTSTKLFSFRHHIDVTDNAGNVVYQAQSKVMSFHDKTDLYDYRGTHIAHIEKKLFSFHERHYISMSGGLQFELSNELFHLIKDITNIEGLGWQLQGNVWELNFALYDQFGRIVAVIGQKMISMHDKYCVDIYQPNAEPIVIAILITLQHMIRDRENSRAAANNSSYSN